MRVLLVVEGVQAAVGALAPNHSARAGGEQTAVHKCLLVGSDLFNAYPLGYFPNHKDPTAGRPHLDN